MKEFNGFKGIQSEISENILLWNKLKDSGKPIVLYGMGDGAEKILDYAEAHEIKIDDIFASDEFVRGHCFKGYRVKRLSEVTEIYGDFIILVAFATRDKSVIDRISELDKRYELYAPDISMFDNKSNIDNYFASFKKNIDCYSQAYNLLADEKSKQVFRNAINFKISAKIKYIREAETSKSDAFALLCIGETQKLHYIDIGAYDGDTILELCEYLQDMGSDIEKVTALEPDKKNFLKLCKNLKKNNLFSKCDLYNTAAWDKKQNISFIQKAGRHSSVESTISLSLNNGMINGRFNKVMTIEANSVDNIISENLRKYDETEMRHFFIKYDVEGCEYEAISGSAETIKKYKPTLAVSMYHKDEDLFKLPLLINKINPSYKFYLRKHEYIPFWDLNLYAI